MRKIALTRRIAVELIDKSEDSADKLLDHVKDSKVTTVYKSPAYKGGKKYISVIETKDKDGSPFYHVRRFGQDSVAFLGYSNDRRGELLCLKQWSSPYQDMHTGSFTGSLDKDDKDVEEIVLEELVEEAGIKATKDRLTHVSDERVGGSTDETVHLYLIDVTGLSIDDKEPENIYEELAQRLWLTLDEIQEECEWKAKLIANYYAGHTLEDKETSAAGDEVKKAAAARVPTLGWRDPKARRGVMQYLERIGVTIHLDYVFDIVPDAQGYKFAIKFLSPEAYAKAKEKVLDSINKPGKLPYKVLAAANPPTDMTMYGDHGPIIDVPPVNVMNSFDFDLQGWPTQHLAEAALEWMKQTRKGSVGPCDHMFVAQHTMSGVWQVVDGEIGQPFAPAKEDGHAGWSKALIRCLRD